MFHVGQLVVCVTDDTEFGHREALRSFRYNGSLDGLTKGRVYTVRECGKIDPDFSGLDVRLVEIVRCFDYVLKGEATYRASRFRPVSPLRLEVFRRMLAPTPKKEAHKAPESV